MNPVQRLYELRELIENNLSVAIHVFDDALFHRCSEEELEYYMEDIVELERDLALVNDEIERLVDLSMEWDIYIEIDII